MTPEVTIRISTTGAAEMERATGAVAAGPEPLPPEQLEAMAGGAMGAGAVAAGPEPLPPEQLEAMAADPKRRAKPEQTTRGRRTTK